MDFYELTQNLPIDDLRTLVKVRSYMAARVQPIINKHWIEDTFPIDLVPDFQYLDIIGKSPLLTGLITMEMGRVDPSIATFYTIQNGLVIGSINALGTEEQKKKWLPSLQKFEKIGCFALTEPDVGSGILDMKTTAEWKSQRGCYSLNGQKKWIGNATWCDISIVWARNIISDKVEAYIIDNKSEGFRVDKIKDKSSF